MMGIIKIVNDNYHTVVRVVDEFQSDYPPLIRRDNLDEEDGKLKDIRILLDYGKKEVSVKKPSTLADLKYGQQKNENMRRKHYQQQQSLDDFF